MVGNTMAAAPGGESLLFLTDEQLRGGIEAMFFAYRAFKKYIQGRFSSENPHDNSLKILNERYARGEIGREEFLEKKSDLKS